MTSLQQFQQAAFMEAFRERVQPHAADDNDNDYNIY